MALLNNKQFAAVAVVFGLGLWWVNRRSAAAVSAVDPTNPDNIFHQGALDIAKEISGDPDWSLYKEVRGDHQAWINNRISEIGWERHKAGLPPLSATDQVNQARSEWNARIPWYESWKKVDLL